MRRRCLFRPPHCPAPYAVSKLNKRKESVMELLWMALLAGLVGAVGGLVWACARLVAQAPAGRG